MDEKELIEKIKLNVVQGRIDAEDEGFDEGFEGQPGTVELVQEAMDKGLDAKSIVVDGLTSGMTIVGERFENGTYLIPDMLASAEAVGTAMDMLAPMLEQAGVQSKGKVVIATVLGDLHDIGKNIVTIMLKGAGYTIIDLGTDVPNEKVVSAVKEHKPGFLGLSALLTTTMREMPKIIDSLKAEGLRDGVKVLIGGAPTTPEFGEKIGADLHCADAFAAVDFANSVTGS